MSIDMNKIIVVKTGGVHNARKKMYGINLDEQVINDLKEKYPDINLSATIRALLSAFTYKEDE